MIRLLIKQQLANSISFFRIICVPLLLSIFPLKTSLDVLLAAGLFLSLCLGDILDGWIARRLKTVSKLGQILDPIADKLLFLILFPLLGLGLVPTWAVFVIFLREVLIVIFRFIASQFINTNIGANVFGKFKTFLLFFHCTVLILRVPIDQAETYYPILSFIRHIALLIPNSLILLSLYVVVLFSVASFFIYLKAWFFKDKAQAISSLKYATPSLLTGLNMFAGSLAVVALFYNMIALSFGLMLLGTLFDRLDGFAARKLNISTTFGKYFDTVSDFVSFGIAPSYFIFTVLSGYLSTIFSLILALAYLVGIVFKLLNYIFSKSSDFFSGLPSPVAAIFVCLTLLFPWLHISIKVACILSCGFLLIWPIRYPHIQAIGHYKEIFWVQLCGIIFILSLIVQSIVNPYLDWFLLKEGLCLIVFYYLISPILLKWRQ